MAKPTVILPASIESAQQFKALAATGPAGVESAARALGLKLETLPRFSRGRVPDRTIYHEQYTTSDEYKGTPADLISVGLMEAHMMPSKVGRKINIPSSSGHDPACRTIVWLTPRVVAVWVYVPQEVAQKRRDAEFAAIEHKERIEREERLRKKRASEAPKSAQEYKDRCLETLNFFLGCVRNTMLDEDGGSGPYSYTEDVLSEFDRLADEMSDLLRDGDTCIGLENDTEPAAENRQTSAKNNVQLQNLLKAAMRADLVQHEKPEAA